MPKKRSIPNIAFMMEFTRKFIDEESSRLDFTLDFNYHLIQRYDKMYRENPDAAEVIAHGIGNIVDRFDDMSDDELRDELCDPYDLVLDILSGKAF